MHRIPPQYSSTPAYAKIRHETVREYVPEFLNEFIFRGTHSMSATAVPSMRFYLTAMLNRTAVQAYTPAALLNPQPKFHDLNQHVTDVRRAIGAHSESTITA